MRSPLSALGRLLAVLPLLTMACAARQSSLANSPEATIDSSSIRALWNFSDPAGSAQRFEARARETEDPVRGELETQLARALGLQGKFAEANTVLDRIEARLPEPPDKLKVRLLLERGRCLNSSGSPDAARPLFVEAWDRARAAGIDDLAVDAAHMVAITDHGQQALDWNFRALELANSSPSPDARRWRTSLFNNIAWTYQDAGDYAKALDYFQQALAESKLGTDRNATRIGEWSVGRALRSLGRNAEALEIQLQVEKECAADGKPDGEVFEEIAENLLTLGRDREAAPYFAQAYDLLSRDPDVAGTQQGRLDRLRSLGAGASEQAPASTP